MKIATMVFLILLLTSCEAVYQVQSLKSNNVLWDGQNFSYQDSLVRINYNFWSIGGRLNFVITNVTKSPLFIDWAHSNLIYNGRSYDYYNDNVVVNSLSLSEGGGVSDKKTGNYYYGSSGKGISIISKEKPQVQIPPNSFITVNKFGLGMGAVNGDSLHFNSSETPLYFRNYLAISTKQDYSSPVYIDNLFWLEKAVKVKERLLSNTANSYYNKTTDTSGAPVAVVVLMGLAIAMLIMAGASTY